VFPFFSSHTGHRQKTSQNLKDNQLLSVDPAGLLEEIYSQSANHMLPRWPTRSGVIKIIADYQRNIRPLIYIILVFSLKL
jgi:hypothetical protein